MKWLKRLFHIKDFHKEPRMYVIVRGDLSETYRMVQGAHALAQFAIEHSEEFKKWNNQYLIFLKVFNLISLYDLMEYRFKKAKISVFKEPDLDNQPTAIAIYDNGKLVQELPLA